MFQHPASRSFTLICGAQYARPASPTDHVAGVPARWVVAPGDARQVALVLGVAERHELSVAVCGSGTKLDWCRPPEAVDVLIDTVRLSGINPDPVSVTGEALSPAAATVGAGSALRSVRAAFASTGRRLPLDVASPCATIGGVLGADESGPLRFGFGSARDLVSGLEFVTTDGAIHSTELHSRLMASTATGGLDRPPHDRAAEAASLLFGACGTLGVITRVTLQLGPLPEARAWVVRPLRDHFDARQAAVAVLDAGVAPAAIEIDLPAISPGELAVLVEGSQRVVSRGVRALRRRLPGAAVRRDAPAWWGRYPFSRYQIALRLDVATVDLHTAVSTLRATAGGAVSVRGSAGAGVVYAGLAGGLSPRRVADVFLSMGSSLSPKRGSCTLLRSSPAVRAAVEAISPAGVERCSGTLAPLAKAWLDPRGRLVPGRMP